MFLFYCMSTSGRDIARNLGLAYAAYSRRREQWRYFQGYAMPVTVNWGCNPRLLQSLGSTHEPMLNRDITPALKKWTTLTRLEAAGIPVPQHSLQWADVASTRYLARKDGLSGGAGIDVVEKNEAPPEGHDFYVRYIPKIYEARLHVFGNLVIKEQFKYIPRGSGQRIRNHAAGAFFSGKPLEDHLHPDVASRCRMLALQAVHVLGLHFAAVDIIITKENQVYILELNTAPGLTEEAGTLPVYIKAVRSLL